MSGYLCRCAVCGREERTGDNPLRVGWPECCGYTMTLVETERFIGNVERELADVGIGPARAALAGEDA